MSSAVLGHQHRKDNDQMQVVQWSSSRRQSQALHSGTAGGCGAKDIK